MNQSTLPALFPEISAHFLQLCRSPSEGLSIFHIAVAHQKMHMCMCCICMHCKQYLISFEQKNSLAKSSAIYMPAHRSVCHYPPGERISKASVPVSPSAYTCCTFVMHLSCYKQAVCKVISVTAESFIQVWFCLYHTIFHLLFSSA